MSKYGLMNQINKEKLIDKFIYELPILRARIDLTQDEISEIAGISRQTYSALETRKRKMTWSNFMALLFVFYFNPATKEAVENAGVFPDELKSILQMNHRL
ncbi:MAG: helix-turn-helix transcriptional regulator [Acetatifactor sp.]|nr:helix-turn-helix transcriptional regulator [Acetatifactor sp.]